MAYDTAPDVKAEAIPPRPVQRQGNGNRNFLDDVANDLSVWIDQTADDVARAFAPGRAPFSANLSEDQKLLYYREQLFNPDGSPNVPGRTAQIQRLGAQGFAQVYKAVLARWPELRIPTPPPTPPPGPPMMPPPGPPPMGPPMPMPPGPPMPVPR